MNGNEVLSGLDLPSGVSIAYANVHAFNLALGNGNSDQFDVLSTIAGIQTTVWLGSGSNSVDVSNNGLLSGIAGAITFNSGGGVNTLVADDSADMANTISGELTGAAGNEITGFGMGSNAFIGYEATPGTSNNFNLVTLKLAADASAAVNATSTNTLVDASRGADIITVDDLVEIAGPVFVYGGSSTGDRLEISPTGDVDMTLATSSSVATVFSQAVSTLFNSTLATPVGTLAAIGMPALLEFDDGIGSVVVTLGGGTNVATISGTVAPVTVDTTGGNDQIFVNGISNQTTINLGLGSDVATVSQTGPNAALIVNGAGATDKLVIDESAATDAFVDTTSNPVGIFNGTSTGVTDPGMIEGLTDSAVTFSDLGRVNVLLGSGNNNFLIDDSFASTVVDIEGGSGNDFFEAKSVGTAQTIVDGNGGSDTLQVDIATTPTTNEFASITMAVEALIINNADNATTAIAWEQLGTEINATWAGGGSATDIISILGADIVEIIGGQTNTDTLQNSLTVDPDTQANVTATLVENTIALQTGLIVAAEEDPAADFTTFTNYQQVINFNDLLPGTQTTTTISSASVINNNPAQNGNLVYIQNGFGLSTSNSGGFDRNDSISPSAQAMSNGDVFTLETVKPDGTVTGDGFTLYSLELANTSSSAITVTLSGKTITGQPVSTTLTVPPESAAGLGTQAGVGFKQFNSTNTSDLLKFFALQDVTISSSNMASLLVNNIVAVDDIANGATGVVAHDQETTFTISQTSPGSSNNIQITTSSSSVTWSGGTIYASDGTEVLGDGWSVGSGYSADNGLFSVSIAGGIATFHFSGNLNIANSTDIAAKGTQGVSFNVTNDVTVGTDDTFNFSASDQASRGRRRRIGRYRGRFGRRRPRRNHACARRLQWRPAILSLLTGTIPRARPRVVAGGCNSL